MSHFFFERRFWPMLSGQSLGAITDNALKQALIVGLPFGVFNIFGFDGDKLLPFMGALFGIGMMIFSPYGGQVADKNETSLMFRRTKFVEFLIMCVAAAGFYFRDGVTLTIALFLMAAQSAFFNPARVSAMPKYLAPQELMAGNAFTNAFLYACIMVGYAIGGGLVAAPDGPNKIAVLLIILAFLGWAVVHLSPKRAADDPSLKIDLNWFSQVTRVFGYVKAEPAVIRPIAGVFLFYFMGTAITVILGLYVRETLGGDAKLVTLLMILFTVGTLIGALSVAKLARGGAGLHLSAIAMGCAGIISILIFWLSLPELKVDVGGCRDKVNVEDCRTMAEFLTGPRQKILVSLFFVSAFFTGIFIVPLQTAIQRRVLPLRRAQIISAGNVLNAMAAILGSLSLNAITHTPLPSHYTFIGVAIIQLGITVYMVKRKSTVMPGLYDEMLISEG